MRTLGTTGAGRRFMDGRIARLLPGKRRLNALRRWRISGGLKVAFRILGQGCLPSWSNAVVSTVFFFFFFFVILVFLVWSMISTKTQLTRRRRLFIKSDGGFKIVWAEGRQWLIEGALHKAGFARFFAPLSHRIIQRRPRF